MSLPSASGTERAIICDASNVLPRADRPTSYGDKGTALHAYLPDAQQNGREAALERVPEEWRAAAEVIDISALPANLASEVALAWDWKTDAGRELGRNIGRAYEVSATEFPGTTDLLGVGDDEVFVADLKTGRSRVTQARENGQLATLALMACRAYGKSRARVALIHMREDGTVYWDVADLSALDLAMHAKALRGVAQRMEAFGTVKGAQVRTVVGSHCKYCPAFHSCSAMTLLAREIGSTGDGLIPPLTPETGAFVWERIKLVELVIERAKEAVKTMAFSEPILLRDGQVLGPVDVKRDEIDSEKAIQALGELYPTLRALPVDSVVTKKSLERLVREHTILIICATGARERFL